MSQALDVIHESFEDIPLDYKPSQRKNQIYGNNNINNNNLRRSNTIANITPNPFSSRSSTNIRSNYSNNSSAISLNTNNSHLMVSSTTNLTNNNYSRELLLTPSQRLKIIKKQRLQRSEDQLSKNSPENLNIDSINFLSDDELPDNLIVFDVPTLHSLQSSSTKKSKISRMNTIRRANSISSNSTSGSSKESSNITNTHNISKQIDNTTLSNTNINPSLSNIPHFTSTNIYPYPNYSSPSSTISSPATRASSIFSKSSDISDFRYSEDDVFNPLSIETKLLTENRDMKLEETLQRMAMLKNMSQITNQSDISVPNTSKTLNDGRLKSLSTSNLGASTLTLTSNSKSPLGVSASTNSLNTTTTTSSVSSSLSENHIAIQNNDKIKYLSSTRQSNLPPKAKYEIMKHEKDYKNLLELQLINEQKNLKQYQNNKHKSILQYEKDVQLWSKVIKDYDILIKLPQTRELWWRNMPTKFRRQIWLKQLISTKKVIIEKDDILNSLEESEKILDEACNYKSTTEESIKNENLKENPNIGNDIDFIEKCSTILQFSFPDMNFFQYGEHFDSILKILISFENLKSKNSQLTDINTFDIINLVCVFYYVFSDCETSFNCIISILVKKLPNSMLTSNDDQIPDTLTKDLKIEQSSIQSSYLVDIKEQFDKYLLNLTSNVYNHFIQRDINSLKIIQSLTGVIFANQLNIDIVMRIIDIYLFEGDIFLLRTCLALIRKISYKLFGSKEEVYNLFKMNNRNEGNDGNTENNVDIDYLSVGDVDEFIKDVRNVLKRGRV